MKIFYSDSKQFMKCVKAILDNILMHILTNPFICRTNENALIKLIYACGKTQATRKDWSAEFINPKSLN